MKPRAHPPLAIGAFVVVAALSAQPAPPPSSAAPPPAFDVVEKSIEDLQRAMASGEVTARQLVDLYLARIAAYDQEGPALNALVALNPRAREAAEALDAERRTRGARGPLHGIPVLVKDNYETIEMPTSAGSIALASFHPARDAFLVQRLKAAGAVVLGKTNMHELAAGITNVGTRYGQTRNPYDLGRNPGGSSGGTGAAVAASFAAAGMGSDTCGSIRIPAAHNNLAGLRGTKGLSSRTGIVPLSSTQDIGGPIARSLADLAILLDATVGPDPADPSTSAGSGRIPASYRAALRADAVKGARIGVVRSLFGTAPEDREVTAVVQKALDALKQAGAELIDVAIPGLDDSLRDISLIPHEFKFELADYLAGADNPPVKSLGEILDRGLFHSALEQTFRTRNASEGRDTEAARRARLKQAELRNALDTALAEHRIVALAYPTIRRKAAWVGDAQAGTNCTVSAHSGLPALSIPAGFTSDELPVGIELLGAAFAEQNLLSLGYSIEQLLKMRRPPFSTPALIAGRRPAPKIAKVAHGAVVVALTYDETTSQLQFALTTPAAERERIAAVWLHWGTPARPGAARHQLIASRATATAGTVTLSAADRKNLHAGQLLARFYVRGASGSAADVPVKFGDTRTVARADP